LRPDLVILLMSHGDTRDELERIGLRTLTVPHETIADIHEAIRLIGRSGQEEDRAAALSSELKKRADAVRGAVSGRDKPRVLICIGRDSGSDQLAGMYMAGRGGYYDEILEAAGGINAVTGTIAYPRISLEGVIELDPDVIVDLVDLDDPIKESTEELVRHWDLLHPVKAVREGRVYVVVGRYAQRPGPRYIQFLEEMALLLHPDAFRRDR